MRIARWQPAPMLQGTSSEETPEGTLAKGRPLRGTAHTHTRHSRMSSSCLGTLPDAAVVSCPSALLDQGCAAVDCLRHRRLPPIRPGAVVRRSDL